MVVTPSNNAYIFGGDPSTTNDIPDNNLYVLDTNAGTWSIPSAPSSGLSSTQLALILGFVLGGGLVLICIAVILIWRYRRRRLEGKSKDGVTMSSKEYQALPLPKPNPDTSIAAGAATKEAGQKSGVSNSGLSARDQIVLAGLAALGADEASAGAIHPRGPESGVPATVVTAGADTNVVATSCRNYQPRMGDELSITVGDTIVVK